MFIYTCIYIYIYIYLYLFIYIYIYTYNPALPEESDLDRGKGEAVVETVRQITEAILSNTNDKYFLIINYPKF